MYEDLANELSYENENLAYDNSVLKDDMKTLVKEYDKLLNRYKALTDFIDVRKFDATDFETLIDDIKDFEQVFYEFRIYLID